MRKILSITLILILTASNMFSASYAENDESVSQQQTEQSSIEKNNRKKNTESVNDTAENNDSQNDDSATDGEDDDNTDSENKGGQNEVEGESNDLPDVLSDAAILINSNTGKILYEKNSNKQMYPASTTKIMTAFIALNRLELSSRITASKSAVSIADDSSKMGIVEGEVLTVEELLYALLVQSANDAANVLAEAVSGSISEFVGLMNQTAQELGMTNTHFSNAHGYHDENHYTTAYDMSLVAQEAMKNSVFAKIVSAKSIEIQPTNKCDKVRKFLTRNYLISPSGSVSQYRYANGIKTGHTEKAGQCFVGSAQKNGMDLITVVFHAPEDAPERAFIDTKNMFEYAYSKYRIETVLTADEIASTCNVKWASGKSHLVLKATHDVKTLLPRENYNSALLTSKITVYDDITAPVKAGDELGEIKYFYDEQEVTTAKLYASRDVSKSYMKQISSYVLNIWFLLIFGLIVFMLVLKRAKERQRAARMRRIRKRQKR